MADNVIINTGTGPQIAAEMIGTALHQKVKFVVGGSGTASAVVFGQTDMATSFPVTIASDQSAVPISGSVSVINTPTVTVGGSVSLSGTGTVIFGATQAVTAANVTIASITAGTVSVSTGLINISGTVPVTLASLATGTVSISGTSTVIFGATQPISGSVSIVNNPLVITSTAPIAVSGGGGGVQYSVGDTAIGATGTGTIVFGINSTTVRGIKVDANGVVAVSGGGGGVQYSIGDTSMAATGTGTLFIGIQSGATTGRGFLLTTTGSPIVTFAGTPAVTAANVTVASITTGSVSVVGGPTFYVPGAAIASGTGLGGPMMIGVQSGATLGRGVMLTTTGHQFVDTVRLLSTGTVSISGTSTVVFGATQPISGTIVVSTGLLNISGTVPVTLASLATGTVSISGTSTVVFGATQAVTAANVTVASITTGTLSATLLGQGILGTTAHGGFVCMPNASKFNAFITATTSAAGGVIILTSGAHTLYVTDLLVSVAGPMTVSICSETTAKAIAYLATNGGFVFNAGTPLICNTAQSLRVVCGSSGSCSVFAAGYTVT